MKPDLTTHVAIRQRCGLTETEIFKSNNWRTQSIWYEDPMAPLQGLMCHTRVLVSDYMYGIGKKGVQGMTYPQVKDYCKEVCIAEFAPVVKVKNKEK